MTRVLCVCVCVCVCVYARARAQHQWERVREYSAVIFKSTCFRVYCCISFHLEKHQSSVPTTGNYFIPSFSTLRTLCFWLSWKIHSFTGFNVVRTGAGVCQLACLYFSFICGYLIVLWFLPPTSWYPSCPRISETWLDCCGWGSPGRATVKPQD